MARKKPELTHKVVSVPAEDTPENRRLFQQAIRTLNKVLSEIELEHGENLDKEERDAEPEKQRDIANRSDEKY